MARVKKCKLCGMYFFAENNRTQYCSDACRREVERARSFEWNKQAKEKKAAAKATPPQPKVSIHDVLRWAAEHKRKTGVYLDYAKAREEMRKEGYPV